MIFCVYARHNCLKRDNVPLNIIVFLQAEVRIRVTLTYYSDGSQRSPYELCSAPHRLTMTAVREIRSILSPVPRSNSQSSKCAVVAA